jgi:hypothetical protein
MSNDTDDFDGYRERDRAEIDACYGWPFLGWRGVMHCWDRSKE